MAAEKKYWQINTGKLAKDIKEASLKTKTADNHFLLNSFIHSETISGNFSTTS